MGAKDGGAQGGGGNGRRGEGGSGSGSGRERGRSIRRPTHSVGGFAAEETRVDGWGDDDDAGFPALALEMGKTGLDGCVEAWWMRVTRGGGGLQEEGRQTLCAA